MESIRRRAWITAFSALLVLVAAPASTLACSCSEWPSVERALLESHAVFRGTVLAIRPADPPYYGQVWVALQVNGWWKGEPPTTIEILTGESGASCGVTFEIGSEYLVYARLWYQPDVLGTDLCWRTHSFWPDDPDLVFLGPAHPVPLTPPTWGTLKQFYR